MCGKVQYVVPLSTAARVHAKRFGDGIMVKIEGPHFWKRCGETNENWLGVCEECKWKYVW